jgi:hypothetical protein
MKRHLKRISQGDCPTNQRKRGHNVIHKATGHPQQGSEMMLLTSCSLHSVLHQETQNPNPCESIQHF